MLLRLKIRYFFLILMVFLLNDMLCYGYIGHQKDKNVFASMFNVEHGLKQSMVNQTLQDSSGLIWLLTGDGLHLFDGKSFDLYKVPVTKEYSYHDNILDKGFELSDGRIILASASSLCVFDTQKKKYHRIIGEKGLYPRLLTVLHNKMALVWTHKTGFFVTDGNSMTSFKIIPENNDSFLNYTPINAVIKNDSVLVVRYLQGLLDLRFEDNNKIKGNWTPFKQPISQMAMSNDHRIIIYSDGRISEYLGGGKLKWITNAKSKKSSVLFAQGNGDIWYSDPELRKTYVFKNNLHTEVKILNINGTYIDTLHPYIRDIFEDRNNNLWFGTDGDGVLLYEPLVFIFDKHEIGFVRGICGNSDDLWVATFNQDVWHLKNSINAKALPLNLFQTQDVLFDVALDSKHRLWIAYDKGIRIVDRESQKITNIPLNLPKAKFWSYNSDTMLLSSEYNLYLIATKQNPEILYKENFFPMTAHAEIGSNYVSGSAFGLYMFPKNVIPSTENPQTYRQISNLAIKSILVFKNRIWTSSNKGIEIFSSDGKALGKPSFLKKLDNEVIYSLFSDKLSRIWFSSNMGIGCIDMTVEQIYFFGKINNLQSFEFNSGAAFQSESGKICFGGIKGINCFDPNNFRITNHKPEIILKEIYISDTLYNDVLNSKPYLEINWKESGFYGSVVSSDYSQCKGKLFSYYLENWSNQWSQPSENNNFIYKKLPHGSYNLYAKCCNSYGIWSEPKLVLSIKVKPPFWKTWWFKWLILLLILSIMVFVFIQRQKALNNKHKRELDVLNRLENERSRISKDLHDEIGSGLSIIMMTSSNNIESNQALSKINGYANELYSSMNSMIWLLNNEEQSGDVLFARIRATISEILEQANINYDIKFSEHIYDLVFNRDFSRNIYMIFKEAINNIVKHANADLVNIELSMDSSLITIQILDNGRGHDTKNLQTGGNGIKNMSTRAHSLGGTFEFLAMPESNQTKLSLKIPIKNAIYT